MKQVDSYGNRVWQGFYPVLTYFGVYYLVFILAGMLAMTFSVIALEQAGGPMDYYVLLEQTALWLNRHNAEVCGVVALLMFPLIWLYRRMDVRASSEKRFHYASVGPHYYLVALVLGVAACLAVNGLLNLSGLMIRYQENLEEVGDILYQNRLPIELITIGIMMPVMEELLFRGLIQERMRGWMRPEFAILASAAVFSLYHGNTLQMIYTAVLGLILGYVYEKYHHILAPILVHIGANLVSVVASEKGIFNDIMQDEFKLVIFTGVFCLLIIGCIYVIHYHVNPALVQKEDETI